MRISLSSERREELTDLLSTLIIDAREQRQSFDQELIRRRNQYHGVLKSDRKDEPWQNAANLHIPATRWVVGNVHARIKRVVAGVRPLLSVTPQAQPFEAAARATNKLLSSYDENIMRLPQTLDDTILNCLIDGTAIVKMGWRREMRTVTEMRMVQDQELDSEGRPVTDDSGQPVTFVAEREVSERRLFYNAPSAKPVALGDYLPLPPNAPSRSAMIAEAQRYYLRPWEVRERVRLGVYDPEVADELLEGPGDTFDENGDFAFVQHRRRVEKMPYQEGGSRTGLEVEKFWRVYECLVKFPLQEGDEPQLMRAYLSPYRRLLLGVEKFPYWHGQSYFIPFRVSQITYPFSQSEGPTSFYGESLTQISRHLQEEMNTLFNQTTDMGTLANGPLLLVRKDVFDKWTKRKIAPGEVMPVEDPGEAKMFTFDPPSPAAFQLFEALLSFLEKLVGVSEPQLGIPGEGGRTAFEIGSLLEEGNVRFADMIERFQQGDSDGGGTQELAYQLVSLLHQGAHQWGALQDMVSILGEEARSPQTNPFLLSSAQSIAERLAIFPHGNTRTSNPQVELNKRFAAFNLLSQHALVAASPVRQWELIHWLLEPLEVDGVERFIGTQQEALQLEQQQKQQMITEGEGGKAEGETEGETEGERGKAEGEISALRPSPSAFPLSPSPGNGGAQANMPPSLQALMDALGGGGGGG